LYTRSGEAFDSPIPCRHENQNHFKICRLINQLPSFLVPFQKRLAMENLAQRQQLAMFKQARPRPMPTDADRVFWVLLREMWAKWSDTLIVVTPDTIVRWHREGFRRYWNAFPKPRKSNFSSTT